MQTLAVEQKYPEVPINENFDSLSHQAVYGKRHPVTTGLTWGYWGGRWGGFSVADGTLTLTDASTNYVVVARATGVVSVSTSAANWNKPGDYARVYRLTTAAGAVTVIEDHRAGPGGVHGQAQAAGILAVAGTARDILPADQGLYLRFTDTGAKTATFDDADGFAAGMEFHIANRAASGDLTLTAAGTMTLNAPAYGTLVVPPGGTVTVKLIDTDEADVFGVTEAA